MGGVDTVEVPGATLAYRAVGDPADPPMVLLHALGEDQRDWDVVLPALARGHRAFTVDLRGHGASARTGRYSFELMRDDVIGLLDAVGIAPAVLVGHSMGGVVALLVAEAAPHLVTHLVMEDMPAPRPGTLKRPPLAPPDAPTPFDFAAVNALRAQLDDPDPAWWDSAGAVHVPTLLIGGGAGSAIPQHLLAATAGQLPDARLVTIDAGHHVHRERPTEFSAAVAAFLHS